MKQHNSSYSYLITLLGGLRSGAINFSDVSRVSMLPSCMHNELWHIVAVSK